MKYMQQSLFLVLVFAVLIVSACATPPNNAPGKNPPAIDSGAGSGSGSGSLEGTGATPPTQDANTSSTNPPATPPADSNTVTVAMTAKMFEFDPSTVSVKQGQHVKLVITSPDVNHGIAIPDFDVMQEIPAQSTVTVEFDATQAGDHKFFCSVYCGAGHGKMHGTITVTP